MMLEVVWLERESKQFDKVWWSREGYCEGDKSEIERCL